MPSRSPRITTGNIDTNVNEQIRNSTRDLLRNKSSKKSTENKTKINNPNCHNSLQEKKGKVLENGICDIEMKRKAEQVLDDKQNSKMPRTDSSSENDFTPRRSSRGVKPNRKFQDMEVNFTPGRKQYKTTEKKSVRETETTKSQNKQNRNVTLYNKSSNYKNTKSCEETKMTCDKDAASNVDNDETNIDKHTTDNPVDTDSGMSKDIVSADFPSIKVIRFDENDKMQVTDFNQKDKSDILLNTINNQSESPDFSIIKEEDLERITSELLELAQNAEQANNRMPHMFIKESSLQQLEENQEQQAVTKGSGDSKEEMIVTSGITVTDIKLVEVLPESENETKIKDSSEVTQQTKVSGQGSVMDKEFELFDTRNMLSTDEESSDSHANASKTVTSGKETLDDSLAKGSEKDVMVENIMEKKTNTNIDNTTESYQTAEQETNSHQEGSSVDEYTKGDLIPLSFMDTEIQDAVKNALMELTHKAVDNEENVSKETTSETNVSQKKEKTEGVSSSATQTSNDVNIIKLPALNPKSRIGPLVKSITVNVQQPEGSNESGDKVNSGKTTKQEFIIVHVPDGQVVKRTQVKVSKPEDLIPYNVDEDGQLHCGMCEYQTHKRVNMYKHRKKHVDDRSHCCPFCKYKTTTSSNLKRHIGIHQDIRNFKCHLCDTTFRQKIHLERHVRYRHEEKRVKCPLCEYVCANENPDLKVHMKRRHLPQDSEDGTYQAFKCDECGMMTMNKRDFKQHMKFHKSGPELKLFCDYCSFVTDCESRLKRHSYIHSKEKPYKCGMCEYRASQKEHVIRHMGTQHGVEIEKRSGKKFDDEDSLTESIDSRDDSFEPKTSNDQNKSDKFDYSSQEKIFACNHCSMKFSKLLNLYKHLHAQHKEILPESAENEFLCVVCDFKTTTKKNLLVHMRKHNQIDQIPPSHVYSCVLCNYINPKRRNLFQHMKKKHGIEVVMKDDGSTSCFVADGSVIASKCDETVQNILTIGDIVTTETEEQELQIVTDDLEKDGIQVQNVISFDDLAYAVSHPQPHNRNLIVVEPNTSLVQQHEAAEAIEGLQALAEQPGIITSHEVVAEGNSEFITAGDIEDVKNETETEIVTMETTEDNQIQKEEKMETENGIQLTTDELMHLSAGDFVEINGEMYKVEISEDTGISNENVADSL